MRLGVIPRTMEEHLACACPEVESRAMSNSVPDGDLKAWITELRARLERGEFTGAPPIDLGYGSGALPAEDAIRIMLADLDDSDTVPLRLRLLDDFRHLRALIG